jgi:hypothetical protein
MPCPYGRITPGTSAGVMPEVSSSFAHHASAHQRNLDGDRSSGRWRRAEPNRAGRFPARCAPLWLLLPAAWTSQVLTGNNCCPLGDGNIPHRQW